MLKGQGAAGQALPGPGGLSSHGNEGLGGSLLFSLIKRVIYENLHFQHELRNFSQGAFVFILPLVVSEGSRTERRWPWDSPSQQGSDPAPAIQQNPPKPNSLTWWCPRYVALTMPGPSQAPAMSHTCKMVIPQVFMWGTCV